MGSEERSRTEPMSASRADVFVGRGEELAGVFACAAEAASGRPWVVLVDGPAGVGKSAFVKHVIAVLAGSGGPRPALRDFEVPGVGVPTFDMLGAMAEEIAQDEPMWLLDRLIGETTSGSPLAGAMELLDVLADRQSQGPVALVLEDLHWADDDSRSALLTAVSRLDGDRVLTLITTRPEVLADDRVARLADDPMVPADHSRLPDALRRRGVGRSTGRSPRPERRHPPRSDTQPGSPCTCAPCCGS